VNVLGSLALGAVSGAVDGPAALALGVGFCGAFTTFSSLAVVVADRLERGARWAAIRYGGGVLVAALAGVVVGRTVVGA
jgi:CrcB protein